MSGVSQKILPRSLSSTTKSIEPNLFFNPDFLHFGFVAFRKNKQELDALVLGPETMRRTLWNIDRRLRGHPFGAWAHPHLAGTFEYEIEFAEIRMRVQRVILV